MNDQERILNIFLRLFFGEKLQKKSLADEFEVNERTIQNLMISIIALKVLRNFLKTNIILPIPKILAQSLAFW